MTTTLLPTNTTRTSPADRLRCPSHDEVIFVDTIDVAGSLPWAAEQAALYVCPARDCAHREVLLHGYDLEAIA